ncbi:hypothetical protein chiPu_0023324 [Chiloscyllium punctatum]|uniref:Uncharacterized protein n=1 Tax=Chiloscyllium punctatum TaxID=137246 RepID=A0A401T8E7_CHIPU|nr:hypothetical protein [Chiloscyllium punctatum]
MPTRSLYIANGRPGGNGFRLFLRTSRLVTPPTPSRPAPTPTPPNVAARFSPSGAAGERVQIGISSESRSEARWRPRVRPSCQGDRARPTSRRRRQPMASASGAAGRPASQPMGASRGRGCRGTSLTDSDSGQWRARRGRALCRPANGSERRAGLHVDGPD